jgi:hypothetical protein
MLTEVNGDSKSTNERGPPKVGSTEYTQSGSSRFSGVYSIMMEKLAQAGEGEGCTPTPFH